MTPVRHPLTFHDLEGWIPGTTREVTRQFVNIPGVSLLVIRSTSSHDLGGARSAETPRANRTSRFVFRGVQKHKGSQGPRSSPFQGKGRSVSGLCR